MHIEGSYILDRREPASVPVTLKELRSRFRSIHPSFTSQEDAFDLPEAVKAASRSSKMTFSICTLGVESTHAELQMALSFAGACLMTARDGLRALEKYPLLITADPLVFGGTIFEDKSDAENGRGILYAKYNAGVQRDEAFLYSIEPYRALQKNFRFLIACGQTKEKRPIDRIPHFVQLLFAERVGLGLLEQLFPTGIAPLFKNETFVPIAICKTQPIGHGKRAFYINTADGDTATVLAKLAARKRRPATAHESFEFLAAYPNATAPSDVVALGSTTIDPATRRHMVVQLSMLKTGQRALLAAPYERHWPAGTAFLTADLLT